MAQSGLEVRFAANAAFRELAQGAVTDKTGSDGRVTLELTALTNDTSQTISVEADGQTLTQSFTVTPGKYALTAEPGSLSQHRETEITFTLTQGGIPVPQGTKITLSGTGVTFDGKAQYTCVTEDASGAITAKVIVSRTDASITATVDGGATATVKLQVTAAKYSLEASPSTLTQHKEQKVVFTLKANSQPLPNAKVTFKDNSDFIGLPTTEQTTDKNGQITVTALTATASGTLSIEAVVNGETVSASLTVGAAKYSLEASPGTLTQHKEQKVVFTLKANSQPLPNAKVTFTPSDNFSGLPEGEQTTDDKGQIEVVNLTALTSDTLTVCATVDDGQQVEAEFVVTKATYTLTADPATLTLGVETEVTFTLQANGNPLGDTAVTLSGENLNFSSTGATTDKDGKFTVKLTPTGSGGNRTITATVGTDTVTVDLSVSKVTFVLTDSGGGTSFVDDKYQTITLKATLEIDGKEVSLDGTPVTWTVASSNVSCEAWMRSAGAYNGLTWGQTPLSLTYDDAAENDTDTPAGTAPTGAEAYLTDIVGERTVTVTATVEYNGQWYTAEEKTVTFGNGPLSVFKKPLGSMSWTSTEAQCSALPSTAELRAVAGPSRFNTDPNARGAAFAAKWPDDRSGSGWFCYWAGELFGSVGAEFVDLHLGDVGGYSQFNDVPVAVCRR